MLQVAVVFTFACLVLTGNAVLSFWPNISPGFTPPPVVLYVEGILSVISSALFLVGGAISFFHIVKTKRIEALQASSCRPNYGTVVIEDEAMEEEDEKVDELKTRRGSIRIAVTELLEKTTSIARSWSVVTIDEVDIAAIRTATATEEVTWRNLPTLHDLRTYYFTEIQCLAGLISVLSSSIYTITGVLALISIFHNGTIATWIRFPQLIAATGFATSSLLLMLQAQKAWWRPNLGNLLWYAGLLNLIGSCGFIFCAVLGLLRHSWVEYHFGSTFLWASWAFLFASALSFCSAFRGQRRRLAGEVSKV